MIRTLIADDNQFFCQTIIDYLRSFPILQVVDVAYDGRDALTKIRDHQPDLLLLDVVMPYVDGFGVLEKLGTLSPATRTIIISALPEENLRSYLGIHKFPIEVMNKPLDYSALLESIKGLRFRAENPSSSLPAEGLLYSLGMVDSDRGFKYIRDALTFSLDNPSLVYDLTGQLYPMLAASYNISAKTVERSIRRSIYRVWRLGSMRKLESIFGMTPQSYHNCPSNGNFIATLLRQLIIEN